MPTAGVGLDLHVGPLLLGEGDDFFFILRGECVHALQKSDEIDEDLPECDLRRPTLVGQ